MNNNNGFYLIVFDVFSVSSQQGIFFPWTYDLIEYLSLKLVKTIPGYTFFSLWSCSEILLVQLKIVYTKSLTYKYILKYPHFNYKFTFTKFIASYL